MKLFAFLFLSVLLAVCAETCGKRPNNVEVPLTWVDGLTGDFSFKDRRSYLDNVFRNQFGQLACNVICDPAMDAMKDENGKIYEDSLESYYKLLDTTGYFHSIESDKSDAWAYELLDVYHLVARRINKDTVLCFTGCNVATHSSLELIITKNTVTPSIVLNSVARPGIDTFACTGGKMSVDKKMWETGILKAEFDFDFLNHIGPTKMYWKGKIYAEIETGGELRHNNVIDTDTNTAKTETSKEPASDTTFISKEIVDGKLWHSIFIVNDTNSKYYDRLLRDINSADHLEERKLSLRKPKSGIPWLNWVPLEQYKGKFYVYSPCDYLFHFIYSIIDTTFIELRSDGDIGYKIAERKIIDGKTYRFKLIGGIAYGIGERYPQGIKLTVHIIDVKKGIAVFEWIKSDTYKYSYLMIAADKIKSVPVIVNDCPYGKMDEFHGFDKPDYEALLK